jgi:uncharacterized protein YciI
MTKHFAYFYLMKREPEKIQQVVRTHIEYWDKHKSENYLGGPFADRATNIINNDPFTINDLLESKWIKEWVPE